MGEYSTVPQTEPIMFQWVDVVGRGAARRFLLIVVEGYSASCSGHVFFSLCTAVKSVLAIPTAKGFRHVRSFVCRDVSRGVPLVYFK